MLWRKVVGILDDADGVRHELRPYELVGAEDDTVFESRVHDAFNVTVHFVDRIAPDQAGDVHVNLGIGLQQRQQIGDIRGRIFPFFTLAGSPKTTAVTFSRSISANTSFMHLPFAAG